MSTCSATMTGNVCASECLCYMQNNIPKHPHALIATAVNGFFTDDEVSNAKTMLYNILKDSKVSNLPRFIKRQSDDKRKLEVDDIISLFLFADSAGEKLPLFVAANLQRVPSVSPGDVDVYALAASVEMLSKQVDQLSKKAVNDDHINRRVGALEANFNTLASGYSSGQMCLSGKDFPPLGVSAKDQAACNSMDSVNASWINIASSGDPSSLNKKKKTTTPRVIGRGTSAAVRAVPRVPVLSAFVGRLDRETTAEKLSDYLKSAGVKVVRCTKLKGKPDVEYKTAAFYVSCEKVSRDLFYDEATWPQGVELRDWYFK